MIDKNEKLVKFALENGIIDIEEVTAKSKMKRKDKILKNHEYTIWQGKNSRWYTYVPDICGKRKQISRKSKEDLEQAIIDYFIDRDEDPTVEQLFDEWLSQKLEFRDIIEATATRYRNDFKAYFEPIRKRKVKRLNEYEIEYFLKMTVIEKHLTRKAFSGIRTIMYGLFRMARKRGLVDYNIKELFAELEISRKAFAPERRDPERQIFFPEDEKKVTDYLKDNPDTINLGLLLLFKSGLRVGELAALKPADILGNKIHVSKTETRSMADGKVITVVKEEAKTEAGNRTVILTDDSSWITARLLAMNPFGEWLFMRDDGRRCTAEAFRIRLYAVCEKVGVARKSPHKIRKTYGTKLYDADLPKSLICDQMGHTDISCLEKYYYFNRADDKQKAAWLNSVSGL